MRLRQFVCAFACAAAVALSAAPVQAQELSKEEIEKARRHFADAQKAFEKGEFGIAAREYAIAYDITKDPTLFYWIGISYKNHGDCQSALVYYQRYINEGNPQGKFKEQTADQVAECRTKLGKTGSAGTGDTTAGGGDTMAPGGGDTMAPGGGDTDASDTDAGDTDAGDTAPAPPVGGIGDTPIDSPPDDDGTAPTFIDEEPSWKRTAGWVAVGTTVAFVTTGAVMGLSARSREEDIENLIEFRDLATGQPRAFEGATRDSYEDLVDEGERFDTLAAISFGLAGASAIAATVFFVLDSTGDAPPDTSASRLVPVVGPDRLGVAAGWEF